MWTQFVRAKNQTDSPRGPHGPKKYPFSSYRQASTQRYYTFKKACSNYTFASTFPLYIFGKLFASEQ